MEKRRARLNSKYSQQVLVNKPDGTISQGIPTDYVSETSTERTSVDATYIVESLEDDTVTEIVDIYCRHRNAFLLVISIQLVLEIILTVFQMYYYESANSQIKALYGNISHINLLFFLISGAFIAFGVVYYSLGYYSVISMRLRWVYIFSYVCIAGFAVQMVAVYLHKFNYLLLFFRLVLYVYSRYIANLISSILLVPGYS